MNPYKILDKLYLPLDKTRVLRTRNIRLIPFAANRQGGKFSYAEWAHVIGIFQTLMFIQLEKKDGNSILDVGCGMGLMGIPSEPFIGDTGRYVGIDIVKGNIDFCRNQYPSPPFLFVHLDATNPAYAPTLSQKGKGIRWPLEDNSFDLVTGLSVWTHLGEEDAIFYFKEVNRVLKPGGKAIITFFLLDEIYERSLSKRSSEKGKYHMTAQNSWIFDQSAYGSDAWFTPRDKKIPESAIGVKMSGLERLTSASNLKKLEYYPGNWKEVAGVYFQDIIVFQKTK